MNLGQRDINADAGEMQRRMRDDLAIDQFVAPSVAELVLVRREKLFCRPEPSKSLLSHCHRMSSVGRNLAWPAPWHQNR
jgi:hypothetical protein